MLPNRSPWIAELRPGRVLSPLNGDAETDVLVVGGGIAGVSTAYFLLKQTNARVFLIEGDVLAHGASGHNAGQVTSQFERGLADLEEEFGTDLCAATLRDLERGWGLLESMRADAAPDVPCPQFKGAVGVSTKLQAQRELDDIAIYKRFGLEVAPMVVAGDWPEGAELGEAYPDLVRFAPAEEIRARLETTDRSYRGYVPFRRAVANSALLVTRVAETMLARHPDRFSVHEETKLHELTLLDGGAEARTNRGVVRARRVVLCTNGFEGFTIKNRHGVEIDARFHYQVYGTVGYMAGYYIPPGRKPAAISYFDASWKEPKDPYYYVTRRPYAPPEGHRDLVCIGGPERPLTDPDSYTRLEECKEDIQQSMDAFLTRTYGNTLGRPTFAFCWHGLMGYTKNGVRLVGAEPCNDALLYNLGCNGIGLLPSVYGGERIARILNGESVPPTFFDPQDRRCALPPKTIPS